MPTILTPIDLSIQSDRALRRASILARLSGSDMRLLHVVEDRADGGAPFGTMAEVRQRLSDIARGISELDGAACDSRVATGDPVEQIALAAEEARASLIVTAPHKRRFRNLIFSPTAEALAKRNDTPVLIANTLPAGGYRRILIPTGLDPASVQIVRTIDELPFGGPHELFMVYIREPLSTLAFNSSQDRENYLREETEGAEIDLRAFLETNQLADRVRPHVRLNRSTVGSEIEQCAAELGCDTIAIGASQKPFFEKMVVGSVAEAVVREVESDIILFP